VIVQSYPTIVMVFHTQIGCGHKIERVLIVGLTAFEILIASYKADQFISVDAYRTNEVVRLPVRGNCLKLKDYVSFAGLKKLISCLLGFEFIFSQQFLTKNLKRFADLHVHHIGSGQISSECVKQLRRFSIVRRSIGGKQLLNSLGCCSSLPCKTYSAGRHAKCGHYASDFQYNTPSMFSSYSELLLAKVVANNCCIRALAFLI